MYLWLGPYGSDPSFDAIPYIAGFGMGASSIALFARVGGGIYTKAADVGADLSAKWSKESLKTITVVQV